MAGAYNVGMAAAIVTASAEWGQVKRDATALRAALGIVMSMPSEAIGIIGPATRQVARLNLLRRAQFAVSALNRIAADVRQARSRGQPVAQALAESVARERRYFGMHREAIWNRDKAAAQVDSSALSYGMLLGWHTVLDKHTSAECRAANGRNFYADAMPLIGFPGGVHPHCRCYPGRPWPGGGILPSGR